MQQRRLGLQTWPVSMETGEGGEPYLLAQVIGPQVPSAILPPSWECVWWGEDLSTYCLSLPPTYTLSVSGRDGPGPQARELGGQRCLKMFGSQEILGSLSPCSPVRLRETSVPPCDTPDTGLCPPLCTPTSDTSLVRLMTVHRAPSARLCGSWGGEEGRLRKVTGMDRDRGAW